MELGEDAVRRDDHLVHLLEVVSQQLEQLRRPHRLANGGEAADVREQDRDGLALDTERCDQRTSGCISNH